MKRLISNNSEPTVTAGGDGVLHVVWTALGTTNTLGLRS